MKINLDCYTNYEDEESIKKYEEFTKNYVPRIEKMITEALKIKEVASQDNVYVGLGVVTLEEIKKINKEFRDVDRETDVLSFPIFTRKEIDKLKNNTTLKDISLGDIVLCMDVIERQAVEYGTGFDREMLYMICHGICHLLGYDHEIESEKKEMRKQEEEILSKI